MRERPIFIPTLHVRKTGKCHRGAWKAGWQFPDVTRPELKVRGRPIFFLTLHVGKTGSCETGKGSGKTGSGGATEGAGIALFQIVLGLMCPGGLSGGGKSQNEAKSRRFGMDMPCRAFYEGVNPKTILNNCHKSTTRHSGSSRRYTSGAKSA